MGVVAQFFGTPKYLYVSVSSDPRIRIQRYADQLNLSSGVGNSRIKTETLF
jgi:hypothetical protein